MIVNPAATSGIQRLATTIAIVLLLFATGMPAAAVCCLDTSGAAMASVHASMPCCAQQCTMSSNPNTGRDHDATITAAPASAAATTVEAVTSTPAAHATPPAPAMKRAAESYAAPPPFLINSQFRI
jgi:hypothetical protein